MRFVSDEKLAAIGVGAAVGHGQDAALVVLQVIDQLIGEFAVGCGVDAAAALAGARGVPTLQRAGSSGQGGDGGAACRRCVGCSSQLQVRSSGPAAPETKAAVT